VPGEPGQGSGDERGDRRGCLVAVQFGIGRAGVVVE
jgi:hypothetical protein